MTKHIGLVLALVAGFAIAGAPEGKQRLPARTNRLGDPLPAEAVSRLGTLRFRHAQFIDAVRYTPDGQSLVSCGRDGVRIWEVATGRQIHVLAEKATVGSMPNAAALTPDGRWLTTASEAGLHLWDVATGQQVRQFADGHYFQVCYSPNGKALAAIRRAKPTEVVLLDAQTGQQLWALAVDEHPLDSLAFTPDGKTILVSGWGTLQTPPLEDNCIRFLDARTGQERRRINLAASTPRKFAISPDGRLIAAITCPDDKDSLFTNLCVWDLASGREKFRIDPPTKKESGRQRYFSSITFTPDSRALLAASGEDALIEYDLATGKERRRLGQRFTNASDLMIAPDGKTIAVAGPFPIIRIIDRARGEDVLHTGGDIHGINAVTIRPDGRTAITASAYTLIDWDVRTGQERRRIEMPHSEHWSTITEDGRRILSFQEKEKTIRLWDLATRQELARQSIAFAGPEAFVNGVAPDGSVLAVGNWNSDTTYLIDAISGKRLQRLRDPNLKTVSIKFSADRRTLVAFCVDHTAQVWDVARGVKLRQIGPMGNRGMIPLGGGGMAYASAFCSEGQWIAYGNQEGQFRIIDVTTGQELWRFEHLPEAPSCCAVSPDGRVLAWCGWHDPVIHLFEIASGKERHTLAGHRGPTYCFAFAADGRTLITGSADTTALVWDLTGRQGRSLDQARTPGDLGACWSALAGADAVLAYGSIRTLAAAPSQTATYLQRRLHPVAPVDDGRIARLIADLDRSQFRVREDAAQQLERLGDVADPAYRRTLAGSPSVEVRRRLEILLEKSARSLHDISPDTLRFRRALEVLELIGTPEAGALLKKLGQGAASAWQTRESRTALERLAKRPQK